MKYPFYQLYSYWVLFICLLYFTKIIHFSPIPSVILVSIGMILILLYKYNINANIKLAFVLLIIHISPLFLLPKDFTMKDVIYTLIIILIYLISLSLQKTNVIQVYKNIIKGETSDIEVSTHFRDIGLI